MDDFSFWDLCNIVARLGIVVIVIVKLTVLRHLSNLPERVGIGLAGSGALMIVPVVIQGPSSPFSEWAGALFGFGVLIYFFGRLQRQLRHDAANREQLKLAKDRRG